MNQDNPYLDDEIDFAELFKALWEGRKLIIIITTVFAIGSVVFSLSLTNYYRSESLLVARTNNQASSSLSQFSGLASMAGISLPGSGDNKAMEAIEIIKSRAFLKHLLAFENILPSIMAPKSFDNGSKKLLLDPKVYDSESNTWKKKSNKSFQKPSYLEAYEVYSKNMISIGQDEMTGFISIYVEHISPVFAKEFLELIIREANLILRQQDIEESSQALQYLKSELAKTPLIGIQDSISALIEAQLETQMLAQIKEDYILVTIDPPFVAEKKSRPSRAFICIIGTILGGLLSVLITLIFHYFPDFKLSKSKFSNLLSR